MPQKPKAEMDDSQENLELDGETKPIPIISFSRNSDVFRVFDENCDIQYSYDERKYTEVTNSEIDKVEKDLMEQIRNSEKRIVEYEKYASSNPDYIQEIIMTKEYLEDLHKTLHYVEFIGQIVTNTSLFGRRKIVADMC